jgi:hypothetical protein
MPEEHYLGNPLLKKANTEIAISQEQLVELTKCTIDPVYFAKNYMKIVTLDHGLQKFGMYPFQERMLNAFHANRFNIVLCSRQAGKSTTVVSYLLHYAIFNNNVNIAVLANKASTARDLLGRLQTGYENLPKWLQQGILSWNKGSLELENGSKIFAASTSASSVRGGSYNVIFLDEFAFVPSQVADNFMSSVYPTITSGKDSKVIVVSCVTKDTYLLTESGYKRIESFIDKDKTGAYITPEYSVRGNNKFYSSTIVVNQGKVPTNIIKTKYETIECSESHYLWSFKNGTYGYNKSKDLSVGDYVAVKYNQQIFGDNDLINEDLGPVNETLALSVGLYVSSPPERPITVDGYSQDEIDEVLTSLGFDTSTQTTKCLPEKVLSWSKNNIIALLRGIFDVPAIAHYGGITLRCVSRELARQVQLLIANLGILGSLVANGDNLYLIELTGNYAIKFVNEIGFQSILKETYTKEIIPFSSLIDIVPGSNVVINQESVNPDGHPRQFLMNNKDQFYLGSEEFFNDNVSEDLIWLKIDAIEKSENEVFDVSLPDIEGDKWAHSVLYNNFLGHQTPYGMNHFYKMWDDAIKQKNKYIPLRVYWHDIPGRDQKFKEETIANIGEVKWNAEFECDFLGSSDTLISGIKLSNLVSEHPLRSHDLLDVYEEPQPDRIYVITVDVAEGVELDYSAFVVFDVTKIPYRVVAKYRSNQIPILRFPDVIDPVARAYNTAYVMCEVNNDSQVAYILYTEYSYPNILQTKTLGRGGQVAGQNFGGKGVKYGIKMSKPVKRTGCLNLKQFIEEDKLIVTDINIIEELSTFVSRYNSFSAEEGKNDDLVACLILFAWLCTQDYFKEMTETDIRKKLREEYEKELEENDTMPFGFMSSSPSSVILDGQKDSDGAIWFPVEKEDDMSFFWKYNF